MSVVRQEIAHIPSPFHFITSNCDHPFEVRRTCESVRTLDKSPRGRKRDRGREKQKQEENQIKRSWWIEEGAKFERKRERERES